MITNRIINTIFYSLIMVFVLYCGTLSLYRFKADMYFEQARRCVPDYAKTHNSIALGAMQFFYWQAINNNPLEYQNYAGKLNSDYIKKLSK